MFWIALDDDAQLRPLEPFHAGEFFDHIERARTHIAPWVGRSFVATTPEAARAVLQRYADMQARDAGRLYGIWRKGVLVGGTMFVSFDTNVGNAEAGCWLEPAAEGHGLVTRSVSRMFDWAFDVRRLHRIEWRTRSDNARSIRVAERLGMRREGVFRESVPSSEPGVRHDAELWAVLASEWKGHRPHVVT